MNAREELCIVVGDCQLAAALEAELASSGRRVTTTGVESFCGIGRRVEDDSELEQSWMGEARAVVIAVIGDLEGAQTCILSARAAAARRVIAFSWTAPHEELLRRVGAGVVIRLDRLAAEAVLREVGKRSE
ncbi:MAG: hypothetical protein RL885_15540 [Planctomycetota bacterium]